MNSTESYFEKEIATLSSPQLKLKGWSIDSPSLNLQLSTPHLKVNTDHQLNWILGSPSRSLSSWKHIISFLSISPSTLPLCKYSESISRSRSQSRVRISQTALRHFLTSDALPPKKHGLPLHQAADAGFVCFPAFSEQCHTLCYSAWECK